MNTAKSSQFTLKQNRKRNGIGSVASQAGMTLLEILVVLGIIGAVIAVIVPQVMGNLDKSRIKNTKLAMGQLTQALTLYYNDCGNYPKSLDGLMTADPECSSWGPEAYLKKMLKDAWNNEFIYESDGAKFTIKSLGKDRRDGGEGYNKDFTNDDE